MYMHLYDEKLACCWHLAEQFHSDESDEIRHTNVRRPFELFELIDVPHSVILDQRAIWVAPFACTDSDLVQSIHSDINKNTRSKI